MALTALVGLASWSRIVPLLAPVLIVAGALAVGVACLTPLPWVSRRERAGPMAVRTIGPVWIPPAVASVRRRSG